MNRCFGFGFRFWQRNRDRQAHGKDRPRSRLALHCGIAAHHLAEAARNRQAEARAAVLAGRGRVCL